MSLKEALKSRIIKGMIEQTRGDGEYAVLVIDPDTSKIISSCSRYYDMNDAGVLVIENIHLKRQKLDYPAIYFLKPSKESVTKFVEDFEDKKPQYRSAHLFFTSRIPNELMSIISNSKAINFIRTFQELNCDFIAYESRVFTFNRKQGIPTVYFPAHAYETEEELRRVATQIISVCLTMNEFPYIRYDGNSRYCKYLADLVEQELKKLLTVLTDWRWNEDRGTLLLVDRSLDPVAPLLHEYSYQAMVNDLLPVDGEVVTVKDKKTEKEEKLLIAEDDSLWREFRHLHIATVLGRISSKFNEFRGTNKFVSIQGKDNVSINHLLEAMKDYPEYEALLKQYAKHMNVADACMNHFDNDSLEIISELEQSLATGLDGNASKVKASNLQKKLTELCQKPEIDILSKLRLIMLYICTQGDLGKGRKDLLDAAGLGLEHNQALINLKYFGVDLNSKHRIDKERQRLFEDKMKQSNLMFMRYVPELFQVLIDLGKDTLSREKFPFVVEPPPRMDDDETVSNSVSTTASVRKTRGRWHEKSESKTQTASTPAAKKVGPRLITFVIGGASFSEVRSCYEAAEQTGANLFIGSTNLLSPNQYLKEMMNKQDDDSDDSDDDLDRIDVKIEKL